MVLAIFTAARRKALILHALKHWSNNRKRKNSQQQDGKKPSHTSIEPPSRAKYKILPIENRTEYAAGYLHYLPYTILPRETMDITRRSFLEMAAFTASAQLTSQPSSSSRPNIILLLGDDHRADALGCYGNTVVKTPHLDKLASEGARFQNHFCTTPICCVSRASIMLGQYASTHGINDFEKPLSGDQVNRSYFARLRNAGYYTGFIGKFGVGSAMPSTSFDVWKGFGGQGVYFPKGEDGPHLTDIMSDQIGDFLREAPRSKPFCLSVSFKAPHEQDEDPRTYLPSRETRALYEHAIMPPHGGAPTNDINRFPLPIQRSENRRRWSTRYATPQLHQETMKGYYALVSGIDNAIGAMRSTLQQLGLAENTIILYSADHGMFHGEHGFAGKWYAHEESIRIPLIIFDPRNRKPQVIHHNTLNIDLHPTILELAGISVPPHTQGVSVAPLISKPTAVSGRKIWFIEHNFPFHGFIPSSNSVRTTRWKYIRYTDVASPFEELYDLKVDPHETNNLAASPAHAKHLETLQHYCTRWKESLAGKEDWKEPVTESDLQHDSIA